MGDKLASAELFCGFDNFFKVSFRRCATKRIFAAISITLVSGIAFAQGATPSEKGKAVASASAASAPATQPAMGTHGRMMRFNDKNTPGWSLMTPEERRAHREKMHGMKTTDECKAYRDEHIKQMESRAQEKGIASRTVRNDPCAMMQRRGLLKQ